MASFLCVGRHLRVSKVWWSSSTGYHCQLLHLIDANKEAKSPSSSKCNSSEEFSSPMDLFISRLNVGNMRVKPQVKSNFKAVPHVSMVVNKVASSSERSQNTVTLRSSSTAKKAVSKDVQCDRILLEFVEFGKVEDALSSLKYFTRSGKFPKSNTLMSVVALCASIGHVDGVRFVRDVCMKADAEMPMDYRHYEAEAIWKTGDHVEALEIFRELFEKHPLQRRKLINLSSFCLRDIVAKNRLSEVEVCSASLEFVQMCGCRLQMPISWIPAANLWRAAFCSESYAAQCFARTLLDNHGPPLLESIAIKIPTIVRQARADSRPDVLLRLIQTLLAFEMKQCYAEAVGAYVEYLCDVEDVSGAKEALRFMNRMSVYVESATAQRLISLLVRRGNKRWPKFYSNDDQISVPTSQYKF